MPVVVDLLARLQSDLREAYAVERELGRGGMATVYLAHDVRQDRDVAVKVLHPDLAAAVGADRFRREIQIVTRLNHPHILPIYDSGATGGWLYYVMPFVDGESLRQKLEREQQLSVEEAVRITCEVAGAIDYAHRHGVVHRDIKPENILLEDGHAIVADFGIARVISEAGGERLTQTGVTLGTPTYMSPEQAMADRILDGRSDVYSLACVLYEMLAGQPPFVGANAQAVIARHTLDSVPSLAIVRGTIPEDVEDAVMRALAKVPADRFATAAEFAAALTGDGPRHERRTMNRARQGKQVSPRRRAAMMALIAIPVLGAAAGAAWWLNKPTSQAHASTLDPKRVAVLYFEAKDQRDSLEFLAEGLTESLIEELNRVRSLDVVSTNGVLPFRGGSPRLDSVGAFLKAGTLVRGSVDDAGDRIRVTVQLVDGASGTDLQQQGGTFEGPKGDLLALRDSLSRQVARFLRVRVGEEVRLREDRSATNDTEAWSLVQRAERVRKDGVAALRSDSIALSNRLMGRSDSLLALAEQADAQWATPVVRRAQGAYIRLAAAHDHSTRARLIDTGVAHANRALLLDPKNAAAFEVRGALRHVKHQFGLEPDPVESATLLRTAEEDLKQAIGIDPERAVALNALSVMMYHKFDRVEANNLARRAYEADAYLSAAPDIIWRLYATYYDLEQFPQARQWCELGAQRYPHDTGFIHCQLRVMGVDDADPDVARAWQLVEQYVERTPSAAREFATREAQMLAAVPIARAGMIDSARRVMERARVGRDIDPRGELLGEEAISRTLIGDREEAIKLMRVYLTSHPEHREGFIKANMWWWRPLKDDPRFKALVGSTS